MATISLSIPESLHTTVLDIVDREGMSLEQFITLAMAEKASAIGIGGAGRSSLRLWPKWRT